MTDLIIMIGLIKLFDISVYYTMKLTFPLHICKTLVLNSVVCLAGTMRAAQIKQYGGPENMYVDSNVPLPEISSPDHVLIRVAATALNRADTLQRKGSYAAPKGI